MFCIQCGKKIPDDSLFCEHCGARQIPFTVHQEDGQSPEHSDSEYPVDTAAAAAGENEADRKSEQVPSDSWHPEPEQVPSDPWHPDNEKKTKGKIVFGVIAGLLVAAALIFWIIAGTKPEVDVLADASLSSVSGYNGYGYLTSDSISSGLSAEKLPDGVDDTAENRADWATLVSVISYSADKSYGLKNGDKIVITAGGNEATIDSLADDLGITVKGLGDSRTITVSGIRERFANGSDVADHSKMLAKLRIGAKPAVKKYLAGKVDCKVTSIKYYRTYFIRSSQKIDSVSDAPDDIIAVFYKVRISYGGNAYSGYGVAYVNKASDALRASNVMSGISRTYYVGDGYGSFSKVKKKMDSQLRAGTGYSFTWYKVKK
ncbi:MAG: zinc ribbon domain-containing protein [Eubacteriaceae bacterium]|jgi:preprotein translocase subunit YajC|nr:zinc ribbon domain-containing protein [Eubacteriaceae bacterium]